MRVVVLSDRLTIDSAFPDRGRNQRIGAISEDIRKGYRRSRVGRHTIYYRITDYGIAVIRILHDRMLPTRHL